MRHTKRLNIGSIFYVIITHIAKDVPLVNT